MSVQASKSDAIEVQAVTLDELKESLKQFGDPKSLKLNTSSNLSMLGTYRIWFHAAVVAAEELQTESGSDRYSTFVDTMEALIEPSEWPGTPSTNYYFGDGIDDLYLVTRGNGTVCGASTIANGRLYMAFTSLTT